MLHCIVLRQHFVVLGNNVSFLHNILLFICNSLLFLPNIWLFLRNMSLFFWVEWTQHVVRPVFPHFYVNTTQHFFGCVGPEAEEWLTADFLHPVDHHQKRMNKHRPGSGGSSDSTAAILLSLFILIKGLKQEFLAQTSPTARLLPESDTLSYLLTFLLMLQTSQRNIVVMWD